MTAAAFDDDLALRIDQATRLLERIARDFQPAALASSFGAEDMVLIDLIGRARLPIRIFTLDTGRLHQETHDQIDRVRERYGVSIDVRFPDAGEIAGFVALHGANGFYRSIALREQCCAIRKVAPLRRALEGAAAWITGLRRGQGVTRGDIAIEAFDAVHGLPKFNPLAEWSESDVQRYLVRHDVPTHALHRQGYPSIGCAPCTRPVAPGEDARAGRWWWEAPEHRECGLHRRPAPAAATTSEKALT